MVATQNPVLTEALRLIDLGYRVFPCGGPSGKEPRTRNGWKDASVNKAQIEQWFRGSRPPNLAIATTKLCVLDIDPIPGSHGGFRPNSYPENPEHQMDLGLVPSSVTPRGGRHFFFKDPGGHIRNSASVLGDYVDIRATGGYVVVAPSTNAHGAYEWRSPLDVPLDDLEPVPKWILDGLESKAGTKKSRMTDEDWLKMCGGVGAGRRNSAMAQLVGKWISMGYDPAETLALAFGVNAQNSPPLLNEEVEKIVRSVHTTHLRSQEEKQDPDVTKALETLRSKGFEPPAGFVAKVQKAAEQKAREDASIQRASEIAAMDIQQATDFLAHEFSWLPEALIRVEQTVSKVGFETYWIVLESGRKIVLGPVAALLSASRINEVIAVEFRRQIPANLRKKGAWSPIADAILRAAVVLDPDFSPEREVLEWLRDYCSDVRRGGEWQRLHKAGLPYIHEDELRVQAYRFVSWLKMTRDISTTRIVMCDLLTKIGMNRKSIQAPDPDESGKTISRSYCCGKIEILDG